MSQTAICRSTEDSDAATSHTGESLSHEDDSELMDRDGYTEPGSVAVSEMEMEIDMGMEGTGLDDAINRTDDGVIPSASSMLQSPNGSTISTEDLARALLAAQVLSTDPTFSARRQQNGSLAGNIDANNDSHSNGVSHSNTKVDPLVQVEQKVEGRNGRAMFRLSEDGDQAEEWKGGKVAIDSAFLLSLEASSHRPKEAEDVKPASQRSRHSASRPSSSPSRDSSRSSVMQPQQSLDSNSRIRSSDVAPPSGRRRKAYRNVVLGAAMWQTHVEKAMDALFRNELTRRAAVTVMLLLASRLGYLLPVPGIAPGAALAASMLHPEGNAVRGREGEGRGKRKGPVCHAPPTASLLSCLHYRLLSTGNDLLALP